jgi:hypothetical protein
MLMKIRLSWFFVIFFSLFFTVLQFIEGIDMDRAALSLFSVNSFLYGFYVSPIVTGQKGRIDELAKTIRAESNALFDMLIKTKKLPRKTRNTLQGMFDEYIHASFKQRKPAEGEDEYERLISFCLEYDGEQKETVDKILAGLVANQQNRSQLSMQLNNKIFSNEWWIMLVLFVITIGFVLFINVGDSLPWLAVKALLCTGLSMLTVNLLKLSTLTHKKSKNIWLPLDNLSSSRFRRID